MLFEYGGKQKYNSRMTAQDVPLLTNTTRLDAVPKGRVSTNVESSKRGKGASTNAFLRSPSDREVERSIVR